MATTLTTKWSRLVATQHQAGARATTRLIVDRLGKRLGVNVNQLIWLDAANLSNRVQPAAGFEFRFLTANEFGRYALDPSNEIDPWLVERIAGPLDFCFAALHQGRLAAYASYAIESMEPRRFFRIGISFPSDVAYLYAGYTHPDFRGQRLHGLVMGLGLRELAKRNVTKLLTIVDWTNNESIKSCSRLGYQNLGPMVTWCLGPLHFGSFPRSLSQLGVKVGRHAHFGSRISR